MAIDNHSVQDKSILFSEKRWQSLTDEQKDWIMQASEAAKEESVKLITEKSEELITFFEEEGLTITYPDTEPMFEAMKPYYDKIEEELNTPGLVEELANL
ncbi:MAG: hypothetical protein R6U40_09575 [Desulfobacterales bacterium]